MTNKSEEISQFNNLADSLGDWRPKEVEYSEEDIQQITDEVEQWRLSREDNLITKHLDKPVDVDYRRDDEFASSKENLPKEVNRENRKKERLQWNDVEPAWRAADPRKRMSWQEFCRDFMGQNYGKIAQSLLALANGDKSDNTQFLKFMMEMGKQGNPQSMQLDVNARIEQRTSMYAVLAGMAKPVAINNSTNATIPGEQREAIQYNPKRASIAQQLASMSEPVPADTSYVPADQIDEDFTKVPADIQNAYPNFYMDVEAPAPDAVASQPQGAPAPQDQFDEYQEATPPDFSDQDDDSDFNPAALAKEIINQ